MLSDKHEGCRREEDDDKRKKIVLEEDREKDSSEGDDADRPEPISGLVDVMVLVCLPRNTFRLGNVHEHIISAAWFFVENDVCNRDTRYETIFI